MQYFRLFYIMHYLIHFRCTNYQIAKHNRTDQKTLITYDMFTQFNKYLNVCVLHALLLLNYIIELIHIFYSITWFDVTIMYTS